MVGGGGSISQGPTGNDKLSLKGDDAWLKTRSRGSQARLGGIRARLITPCSHAGLARQPPSRREIGVRTRRDSDGDGSQQPGKALPPIDSLYPRFVAFS